LSVLDWLDDSRVVTAIYGSSPPSLRDFELTSLNIIPARGEVVIGIVVDPPLILPRNWLASQYNAVGIEINFFQVSEFLSNWMGGFINSCAVNIEKMDRRTRIKFFDEQFSASFSYEFSGVLKISPFIRT